MSWSTMKINGLKILVTFLPLCSSQTSINSYLQLALLYLTLHILPFALVFKHAQISPNLRNIFPEPPPPLFSQANLVEELST